MKLLIELPDKKVIALRKCAESGMELDSVNMAVVNGTPLPVGAEILTKEAYSDLCLRASHERKTGRWIEKDGLDGDVYYDCSACGESWTTIEGTPWDNDMNYCPHCGAKMEGADNER